MYKLAGQAPPPLSLQERQLRSLWEQHQAQSDRLQLIAENLSGGFSKGQVGSQLRRLGLNGKSRGRGGLGGAQLQQGVRFGRMLGPHALVP